MTPQEKLQALALSYQVEPADRTYRSIEKMLSPLIRKVAQKYANANNNVEDLEQIARVAITESLNDYNSLENTRYATFVHRCICLHVARWCAENNGVVSTSRYHYRNRVSGECTCGQDQEANSTCDPKWDGLCEYCTNLKSNPRMVQLNEDDEPTFHSNPDSAIIGVELLNTLTPKERTLINLLVNCEFEAQEVSEMIPGPRGNKVSPQAIGRWRDRVLDKLAVEAAKRGMDADLLLSR